MDSGSGTTMLLKAVLTLLVLQYVASQQCPYKECTCAGSAIDCTKKNLTAIPTLQYDSKGQYTQLDFTNNNIKNITKGQLPSGIVVLNLKDNPIGDIADDAFEDSKDTLNSLYFRNAVFSEIPQALAILTGLQDFRIARTPITDWNANVLASFGKSVVWVQFEEVVLTRWPSWLIYFPNLSTIILRKNGMSYIPDHALYPWAKIVHGVILSYNNLTTTTFLAPCTNLGLVSMDNNNIQRADTLEDDLIGSAAILKVLIFGHNQMTTISDLSRLTNLDWLSLQYNQLTTIKGLPTSLTHLDLWDNALTSVPASVKQLVGLQKLYLSDNPITKITKTDFPVGSKLNTLFLYGCSIQTIDDDAFANILCLEVLILTSTQISQVPNALSTLSCLNTLGMRSISNLTCGCEVPDLGKWFQSRTSMYVYGYCGQSSIQKFYQNYDENC